MPVHEQRLLVPYTAEEMFDLVADVERYPEFVTGYREARVLRRDGETLHTEQRVGLGLAQVRFQSVAHLDRPRRIQVRSVDHPFDALEIEWEFVPEGQACRVSCRARVRLRDSLTRHLLQGWFDRLAEFLPPAFARRAQALYGQRDGPGPR